MEIAYTYEGVVTWHIINEIKFSFNTPGAGCSDQPHTCAMLNFDLADDQYAELRFTSVAEMEWFKELLEKGVKRANKRQLQQTVNLTEER